ncbi:MAG: methyltransferase RsmF C-terminal domain-like protein [Bacteroidaceae bacterium]|jgi:16S rRNA (cytosine1407-C5)-methyltransferase
MSLPEDFIAAARRLFPAGESDAFLQAIETEEPHTSVRLNSAKLRAAAAAGGKPLMLSPEVEAEQVPWCPSGSYLRERFPFTFDPLFHAGAYYVQEASSMFLAQLPLSAATPLRALDLCAAPGGKSTLLRSLLPEGSLLVSNEVVPQRAAVLCENMQKWGHPDCLVTSARPDEFGRMEGAFDLILADVPCSGEGMFRKDPEAVAQWSLRNVEQCARRQREIIAAVWPALRGGGLLAYSTCTYNTAENEDNVRWICRELGAEPVALPAPPEWNLCGSLAADEGDGALPVYRFLPHRARGEGFFFCLLRKGEGGSAPYALAKPSKGKARAGRNAASPQIAASWLDCLEQGGRSWQLWGDETCAAAVDERHVAFLRDVQGRGLKVLSAGVPLCVARGRDLLPHPALALSTVLRRDGRFPEAALSYDQALAYLRRESLQLGPEVPRGIVLLTYASVPLGFVKNIGNRSNNLFPAEWRIRTTHLPAQSLSLLA